MIIVKNRTLDDEPWRVFHAHNTGSPATEYLTLNTAAATVDNAAFWNDTMPSATVFTLGQDAAVNGDEATIAYCFHSVDDYSKLGSYFGNGNANGAFVYTGFRPAWVLLKKISNAANGSSWCIHDNKRLGYNNVNDRIRPNTSGPEDDDGRVEIVSNGFKMRVTYQESNEDNVEYVYMAFAETPFKYSNAR
jgi:hypothetical protein